MRQVPLSWGDGLCQEISCITGYHTSPCCPQNSLKEGVWLFLLQHWGQATLGERSSSTLSWVELGFLVGFLSQLRHSFTVGYITAKPVRASYSACFPGWERTCKPNQPTKPNQTNQTNQTKPSKQTNQIKPTKPNQPTNQTNQPNSKNQPKFSICSLPEYRKQTGKIKKQIKMDFQVWRGENKLVSGKLSVAFKAAFHCRHGLEPVLAECCSRHSHERPKL